MENADQKTDEFKDELVLLIEKYKMKNVAVCGQYIDGDYFGFFAPKMRHAELFQTVVNVGRMWQYSRETVRKILTDFDIKNGW